MPAMSSVQVIAEISRGVGCTLNKPNQSRPEFCPYSIGEGRPGAGTGSNDERAGHSCNQARQRPCWRARARIRFSAFLSRHCVSPGRKQRAFSRPGQRYGAVGFNGRSCGVWKCSTHWEKSSRMQSAVSEIKPRSSSKDKVSAFAIMLRGAARRRLSGRYCQTWRGRCGQHSPASRQTPDQAPRASMR
jgi:hypothetical protein